MKHTGNVQLSSIVMTMLCHTASAVCHEHEEFTATRFGKLLLLSQ